MQTIAPVTVTGATFTIRPVGPRPATYKKVVIGNQSPWVLRIVSGSETRILHPFTVDVFTYDPSLLTISIEPLLITTTVGVASVLTAVFYEPGEELPESTYPGALPQVAVPSTATLIFGPTTIATTVSQDISVTPYASYALLWNWTGGAVDATGTLALDWYTAGGVLVYRETIDFVAGGSATLGGTTDGRSFVTGPAYADTLRITPTYPSGSVALTVHGSSRTAAHMRIGQPDSNMSKNELLRGTLAVNAATTSPVEWAGPQPGPAFLRVKADTTAMRLVVALASPGGPSGFLDTQLGVGEDFFMDLLLPRKAVGLQLTNNSISLSMNPTIELVSTQE